MRQDSILLKENSCNPTRPAAKVCTHLL